VESLKKVFSVIDLLNRNKEMKLQEIANALEMYKSTVHRIVSILVANGYLDKDGETKKYKLGLKFVDVASHVIENLDIRAVACECIEELNSITKETVHLAMLLDNQAIYVDKKESTHAIRMYSQIGKIAPLYCTGVGKAILAFQPPDILNKLVDSISFHQYTPNTVKSRKQLLIELDSIRKDGYALDREEHEKNMICLAAPVRDYTKKVIASISITAVSPRMSIEELLSYKEIILEKGFEISRRLGYSEK